jgi:hypothetical protein
MPPSGEVPPEPDDPPLPAPAVDVPDELPLPPAAAEPDPELVPETAMPDAVPDIDAGAPEAGTPDPADPLVEAPPAAEVVPEP